MDDLLENIDKRSLLMDRILKLWAIVLLKAKKGEFNRGFLFLKIPPMAFTSDKLVLKTYIDECVMNKIKPTLSHYRHEIIVIDSNEHISDFKQSGMVVYSDSKQCCFDFITLELAKAFCDKINKIYKEY